MDDLIKRWQAAALRAGEERVRVVQLPSGFFATSTSQPLRAYSVAPSSAGWTCECTANAEYHLPCKHLAALAELLDLDVLGDMRVDWPSEAGAHVAA